VPATGLATCAKASVANVAIPLAFCESVYFGICFLLLAGSA